MKRRDAQRAISFGILSGLLVLFVGIASEACRKVPPTVVTPSGQTAYQLEDLVDAVNTLQHEAIAANHAGILPRATVLKIVQYRKAATSAIDKAIDAGSGKEAALAATKSGLESLEQGLNAAEKTSLAKYIAAIRTVLIALT